MNFFDDDFGLSNSPVYPSRKGPPTYPQPSIAGDQMSRKSNKSAKKDQFDDLLDDLLSKEEKKLGKKKERERESVAPYSSTQLDFISPSPQNDFKRTQKWSTPNIDLNRLNQSPKFPRSRMNSLEDRGSEDGKSYKSGVTGRQQQFQFDNLMTLRGLEPKEEPVVQRSTRNMMRPPLAKNSIKESSVMNDDISIKFSRGMPESTTNIEFGGDRPRSRSRQGRSVTPQVKNVTPEPRNFHPESRSVTPELRSISPERSATPEVKQRVIERQKVVTVRQQATELKKQLQNQLKQIKDSYERQLKQTRERWREEIDQSKKSKQKLKKQYEIRLQEQRIRLTKINDQNMQRIKQMHQWQLKTKSQSYELQISKLSSLSKLQDTLTKQQNHYQMGQEGLEFKAKERELAIEKKGIEDLKYQLSQRQKNLELLQSNFQKYRKKQEEKLIFQRRTLFEKENELRKIQMEQKRAITSQRQKMASELANVELDLLKKKEAVNLERDEVRISKELFERQKHEFQQFNRNLMSDYKEKLKDIDSEKQKMNDLQIELYKKIHVVDLTAGERGVSKSTQKRSSIRPSTANQENNRNRTNTFTAGWAQETKDRYREMQAMARKNAGEIEGERERVREKVNLSGYINRLNRAISRH